MKLDDVLVRIRNVFDPRTSDPFALLRQYVHGATDFEEIESRLENEVGDRNLLKLFEELAQKKDSSHVERNLLSALSQDPRNSVLWARLAEFLEQ